MSIPVNANTIDDIEEGDQITVTFTRAHIPTQSTGGDSATITGYVDDLHDVEHGVVGFEASGKKWLLATSEGKLISRHMHVDPSTRGYEAEGTYTKVE